MKCLLLLLWCCLMTSTVLSKPLSTSSDTTRTPDWLLEKHRALSLTALPIATHRAHFRFSTGGCLVEGWREANGAFAGRLVLWTEEVSPGDEVPTHRVHQGGYPLDSTTVRGLFGLLKTWRMRALPDGDDIAGWQPTLDGVLYTLEYATPTGYAVKSYANPASQGALPEAGRVLGFERQVFSAVQLPSHLPAFIQGIPFQCYSTSNGSSTTCRILTNTELGAYKQERNRYRRTLK